MIIFCVFRIKIIFKLQGENLLRVMTKRIYINSNNFLFEDEDEDEIKAFSKPI